MHYQVLYMNLVNTEWVYLERLKTVHYRKKQIIVNYSITDNYDMYVYDIN